MSPYYYCYNYDHLLKVINNTFKQLVTLLPAFDPYFTGVTPVYGLG